MCREIRTRNMGAGGAWALKVGIGKVRIWERD